LLDLLAAAEVVSVALPFPPFPPFPPLPPFPPPLPPLPPVAILVVVTAAAVEVAMSVAPPVAAELSATSGPAETAAAALNNVSLIN
jgi:hypothetical protein